MENYHVVLVGRSGGHLGTAMYVTEPTLHKKFAIQAGEEKFRRDNKLSKSVALISRHLFSGTKGDCVMFVNDIIGEQDKEGVRESRLGPGLGYFDPSDA